MRFAHLSDCHIGGWRDQKLKELGLQSFLKAIEISIDQKVDFILIAGDLFDTALPQIDLIKKTAEVFRELKRINIPVYIIPGSHDFSYSGKTMIDVFEKAGLVVNVMKLNENHLEFSLDQKTGAKITGIYGRKGGLEVEEYDGIDFSRIEKEIGFKIFMFHTLLTELKPKEFESIETSSIKLLPKKFDYYAGGHPHFVYGKSHDGFGVIAYPGPTFPNSFSELETLKCGTFFIVDAVNGKLSLNSIPLQLVDVLSYTFDLTGVNVSDVAEKIKFGDATGKIVLLRLEGELVNGRIADIDFKEIFKSLKNAYVVLKNTSKLISNDEKTIEVHSNSVNEVETNLVKEYITPEFNSEFIFTLMNLLSLEKGEGEKNIDFENRLLDEVFDFIK